MAEKKIGRGLSALLGDDIDLDFVLKENYVSSDSLKIDIKKIRPNQDQPRKYFNEESISQLSQSIKQYGLLQPIIVRKLNENDYIIISGERRWRACNECGLEEISVIIKEENQNEDYILSVIENIQRENLSFLEEINAYRTLIERYSLTHEELSKKISKSRSYITNMIRISKLPEKIIEYLDSSLISIGHAKILSGLDNPLEIANIIIENNLSVRQTEEFLRNKKQSEEEKQIKSEESAEVFNHENNEETSQYIDNQLDGLDEIENKFENFENQSIIEDKSEISNEIKELNEISKMISKKIGFTVKIKSDDSNSGFLNISYSNKKELEEIINKLISWYHYQN